MGLYGAAHGWRERVGGAKRLPLPKMSQTYLAMVKLGTVIPYLKKIQKIYYMREAAVASTDINDFSRKIGKFCYIKKYGY